MTLHQVLSAWGTGSIERRMNDPCRDGVWRVSLDDQPFVMRKQVQSESSARWLARVLNQAARAGLFTPRLVPTTSGKMSTNGWTLETWIEGNGPARPMDLGQLRGPISRFHRMTRNNPCCPGPLIRRRSRAPRAMRTLLDCSAPSNRTGVIHGDLHPGNLIRISSGQIALIDWAEARRDLTAIDEAALSVPQTAQSRLGLAAQEAAFCWSSEPLYARGEARRAMRSRGITRLS